MKMMVLMGCCRCGGKKRCFRWRGISVVERVEDELVAAWLGVAESTVRESVERETCCRKRKKTGEEAGFFVNFGLDFLLHQAINSASIYRRWKRAILSIPGKNFSP
jgi:hypothetical protein